MPFHFSRASVGGVSHCNVVPLSFCPLILLGGVRVCGCVGVWVYAWVGGCVGVCVGVWVCGGVGGWGCVCSVGVCMGVCVGGVEL